MQNRNCEGKDRGACYPGAVRLLPVSSNPDHGNSILCRACYLHEMQYRRERKAENPQAEWLFPKWEELKIYKQALESVRLSQGQWRQFRW